MIEQVLERLRANAVQTAARPRRAPRLRGPYSDRYRETVEALAERMLDILRLNEDAAPLPHLDARAPLSEEPATAAVALQDDDHADVTVEHHSVNERSERRPLITLKGNVTVSDRASLYAQRQGVQVQVVKRRIPSAPQVKPVRFSDPSAPQAERRNYKQKIEALYWPSISGRELQAESRVNPTAARSEPRQSASHTPLQPENRQNLQPTTRPAASVRVEPVATPSAPEHRDGRIHFEYDDTVRKLAEPLRKAIKQVGIKRYGILTCFEVITDMLGYDGYNDFMDRFEDFPPSPTDLQASSEERIRRYRQYCAALEKHGLSTEQAKEAIKLSRKGEWFGFEDIQDLIQEHASKAGRERAAGGGFATTTHRGKAPNPLSKGEQLSGRMVPTEIMGFDSRDVAFAVGKRIGHALRKRGIECGLNRGREYAARMFGYENLNTLIHSCHTRPRSLPDDQVSENEKSARLSQYAKVLIAQGLSRSEAIDVLRASRIGGWLAFWGRDDQSTQH